MKKLSSKTHVRAVLAALMCVVILAPSAILAAHLSASATACCGNKDASSVPLPHRHQENQCPICQSAIAISNPFFIPQSAIVYFFCNPTICCENNSVACVSTFTPHIAIPRAPPFTC